MPSAEDLRLHDFAVEDVLQLAYESLPGCPHGVGQRNGRIMSECFLHGGAIGFSLDARKRPSSVRHLFTGVPCRLTQSEAKPAEELLLLPRHSGPPRQEGERGGGGGGRARV